MKTARRVLVVDDDDSIRDFIELALSDHGYEVKTAAEGAAALKTAARFHPHLILLDMRMSGMDGWKFARAYRKTPGEHARIAVLTAARSAAEPAAEIEADAYLAKPFDLADLLKLVEKLTGGG